MVQRRIADIVRNAARAVTEPVSWAQRYKTLLAELTVLVAPPNSPDPVAIDLRTQLVAIVEAQTKLKAPSRASLIREQLINTAQMQPGYWRVRLDFTAGSQTYFVEKELTIR